MSFWFIIYYILRLPHVFYPARKKKKKDASQFFLPLLAEHIFFYVFVWQFFQAYVFASCFDEQFLFFFSKSPYTIINKVIKISGECTILNRLIWSSLLSSTIQAPVSFGLHQST